MLFLLAESPLKMPRLAGAGLVLGDVGDMMSLGGDAAPMMVALRLTARRMSL